MGVDWIKLHVSGMVPRQSSEGELKAWSLDELKLACDTAHELGIPVVGHCRGPDSVRDALLAGFDMILHGTYMDEEGLEIMIDRNVPLVPTFTFQANLIDYAEKMEASTDYKDIFEKEIQDNVPIFRKAFEAGVPFICGSESGFSVTPYGDWHYKELEVFVEKLGLSPLEAITCATKNAASAMKRDDIGVIAEGKIADLLVVDGDPSKDVKILGNRDLINHVFLNGKDINLTPAPKRIKDPDGWRISAYSNKILEK
jgi:imidazolonepropionase-like amidohydrolase